MSGYGQAIATVSPAKMSSNRQRKIRKATKVKLGLKQRFRNWLMSDPEDEAPQDIYVEEDKLSSDGMRLQIYKASGGFVVETRGYDRLKDRNHNTMHVIRDDQDLGEALGRIVMMEALQR